MGGLFAIFPVLWGLGKINSNPKSTFWDVYVSVGHCWLYVSQASPNSPSCPSFSSRSCNCPSQNSHVNITSGRMGSTCKDPKVKVLDWINEDQGGPRAREERIRRPWQEMGSDNSQRTDHVKPIDHGKEFKFYPEWDDISLKSFGKGMRWYILCLIGTTVTVKRNIDYRDKKRRKTT